MLSSGKSCGKPNWRTVFGVPVVIGLLSAAGLTAALLLGEAGRYFSWIAVGSPVILVAWLRIRRFRRSP